MPTAKDAVRAVLEYLEELFNASPKETFTQEEVLRIIALVKCDPEILERLTQLEPN